MESTTFRQDMPPVGGYRPLNFERTYAKKFLTFGKCFSFLITTSALWHYYCRIQRRKLFVKEVEYRSGFIALQPVLFAERDRTWLKQLIKNREEEADLMKNVPNWKVGHYYSEPVFYTRPEEEIIEPNLSEYYIHTRYRFLLEYFHFEFTR